MTQTSPPAKEEEVPVIVVGAGPVGMLLAYQLHRLNVPCLLAERSLDTTKWPKMDLTNCRSMELLRVLGLADEYRNLEGSVDPGVDFNSLFVTRAMGGGKLLGAWRRPTVPVQRELIKQTNDGSQPAEPGHRCMQILFEAWLKDVIQTRTQIKARFGWKYLTHVEDADGVLATFVDVHGHEHTVRGRYLVGCDGGSSRVRKTARIKMVGGQIPAWFYLVHFRSQELAGKLTFGRSWHTFPVHTGFLIDQDGKDTFTAHYPVNRLPSTQGKVDPREVVYRTLAGPGERHEIKIDEILVHSEWTPNFSIAEKYHTDSLKVFLAGDAAHRMPPHGGYGMNSGVLDAVDLAWRLAALHKTYGGAFLLQSYNSERRAMMIRCLERALRHLLEHVKLAEMNERYAAHLEADTPAGEEIRAQIRDFIDASGPDTTDLGIEVDLRYTDHSSVIYHDGSAEHEWNVKRYIPSTRPGCRVPHVFLGDGTTSTYDLFGVEWTLVQFVNDDASDNNNNPNSDSGSDSGSNYANATKASDLFLIIAAAKKIPLKRVILRNEHHAYRVWESRDLVLVRPDTHVAWRGYLPSVSANPGRVEEVLSVVSGNRPFAVGAGVETRFRDLVAGFTDMHAKSSSSASTIVGE